MSLLLDALKKAAEKKARSNAEKTEIEPTEVHAEESTEVDSTVAITETQLDPTRREATEFTATHIEDTQLDSTSVTHTHAIDSEIDETVAHDATELDETAIENVQVDLAGGEDETVRSTVADETESLVAGDAENWDEGEETVVLTPDDVTEFLGDGVHQEPASHPPVEDAPQPTTSRVTYESSDDTTVTNSEQLDLTHFEHDESLHLRPKDETDYPTVTDTASINHYEQQVPTHSDDDDDHLAGYEGLSDEETTVVGSEATSSTIDIERLTNDETITVKDSTSTRTFAPDNYDRTLLKISDGDVSKIFPGMKSESDTVMTPEYAKKVFQSKSQGVKSHYYKIYLIVGALILAGVLLWGMFSVSDEIEMIDNSLVRLKRDPMPGLIKSKSPETETNLFAQTEGQPVDDRVIEVVASATGTASGAVVVDSIEEASPGNEQETVQTAAISDTAAATSVPRSRGMADEVSSQPDHAAAPAAIAPSSETREVAQAPQSGSRGSSASAQAPAQSLKISSTSRVSEKDQLLTQAYSAYDSGNIDEARSKYQRVLELEPDNRDALLGRAAVHVLDNQFEQAIALYQKLLVANPKDDVAMTSLISVASIDPRAGETEVKRLLNERPDSPYLHFALGNMFGNQQRWSEAQASYFNALKYKPNDPNYAYNLAVSLEHLQQSQSAITYYQRALDNRQNALATFSSDVVVQRIEVLGR